MALDVRFRKIMAGDAQRFELDIAFCTASRRVALLGPSGAGKSLTLRAIAGLLKPDTGRIALGERVLYAHEKAVFVTPRHRRVAYLFQDYALFPHLTVAQNVVFGLSRHWLNPSGRRIPPAARHWIDAFELGGILSSYPHAISGGQRQRVALARALVTDPDIVLLDEPFAALDTPLRVRLRQALKELQNAVNVPMVIITHDEEDARILADRIYRIREGRIVDE